MVVGLMHVGPCGVCVRVARDTGFRNRVKERGEQENGGSSSFEEC